MGEVAISRPGEAFVRRSGVSAGFDLDLDYEDREDIAKLTGALRRQDVGEQSPVCAIGLSHGGLPQTCLPQVASTASRA